MKTLYAKLPESVQAILMPLAQVLGGWALWLFIFFASIALYASNNYPEKLTDQLVEMLVQNPIYFVFGLVLALRICFYVVEEAAAQLLQAEPATPLSKLSAAIVKEDKEQEE